MVIKHLKINLRITISMRHHIKTKLSRITKLKHNPSEENRSYGSKQFRLKKINKIGGMDSIQTRHAGQQDSSEIQKWRKNSDYINKR
uniref:Putative ovule protein n=1 Tax=Solanum chacoense TaxID=4108 RepID=A0A0V0GY95_SOLCH